MEFPKVDNKKEVGKYDELTMTGGGLIWSKVLEYRVWTKKGMDLDLKAFTTYKAAAKYQRRMEKKENVIYSRLVVLISQDSYYKPDKNGGYENKGDKYKLINKERITEWKPEWLFEEEIITKVDEGIVSSIPLTPSL